jgi:N-methylhydantoinase A
MRFVVGIDTGGTFTDCVAVDDDGKVHVSKVPSSRPGTPDGVVAAMEAVASNAGLATSRFLESVQLLALGQTAGLNAVLTRSGAKAGMLATRGHGDAIMIGRAHQKTAGLSPTELMFPARFLKPEPLVPRALIRELAERIDYKGAVIAPLDKEEVRAAVRFLVDQGVESIAVSLLWSFKNDAHEQLIKSIIREGFPDIFVSLSSEVAPVIGEYERTATTVINSYVGPVLSRYVGQLTRILGGMGLRQAPVIMQSGGGVLAADEAAEQCVRTLNSGPIGGVVAAKFLGEMLGIEDIITTDVGGTSFDVGLLVGGIPIYARKPTVDQFDIAVPSVDIHSIGAGGGSVAWIEPATGLLHVGPEGAGADPGPACYGKGGTRPTVTDAAVILGYLDPGYFLGGSVKLDADKAIEAMQERICAITGQDVVEAAAAIFRIVNAQMADLIRKVVVEKGYAPGRFSLFVFGGAGPVHGIAYGAELGVRRIVIPAMSSALSAFGIAASDILYSESRSDPMPAPFDVTSVSSILDDLEQKAVAKLHQSGAGMQAAIPQRWVSLRYRRQIHNEVWLPLQHGNSLNTTDLEELSQAFEQRYEQLYGQGSAFREAGLELVSFRVDACAVPPKPKVAEGALDGADPTAALKSERDVHFLKTGFVKGRIYDHGRLQAGNSIPGPAIIEAATTTVVIPPGFEAMVDRIHNIVIEAGSGGDA